jgi:hypothetical protein
MEQLLWPERRAGKKSIKRTTQRSRLELDGGRTLCVRRGTPVDLITNIRVTPQQASKHNKLLEAALCQITGSGVMNPLFLHMDNAPDFIQDRGHTYGAGLPDADKRALIEYVKTF